MKNWVKIQKIVVSSLVAVGLSFGTIAHHFSTASKRAGERQVYGAGSIRTSSVKQIPAIQQSYSDCGLHAAVNARCIDACIERRQPLTTVTNHASRFYTKGAAFLPTINNLYDRDIMSLTKTCFSMDNCCVFALDHDVCFTAKQPTDECCQGIPDYSGPLLNNRSIRSIVTSLKNKSAGAAHFVCHVPNHWVLVSMIKERGSQKPYMTYMDSMNTPLDTNRPAQECVDALYWHYFAPLLA